MIVDNSNILRVDLPEIYAECERRTAYKSKALGIDIDTYVLTSNEQEQLHSFAMTGAGEIANKGNMIKSATQTGVEALSYTESATVLLENPAANDNGVVPETMSKTHEAGQKLDLDIMDLVIFEINSDIKSDHNRYTVVQGFIKEALICFVLYKWWLLMDKKDIAAIEFEEYEKSLSSLKFNAVNNHADKCAQRKVRYY